MCVFPSIRRRLDFVVNPWSIKTKRNRSFVVSVVLIALVQSVRKSDGRICGDRALIEERSVLANCNSAKDATFYVPFCMGSHVEGYSRVLHAL